MDFTRISLAAALLFSSVIGLAACGQAALDNFGGNPTPEPTPSGPPRFARDILPIIRTAQGYGCGASGACHNNDAADHPPQDGLALTGASLTSSMVWENIRAGGTLGLDLDTANAPASRLVTYPRGGDNDQHPDFFGEDDPGYKAFVGWIANGAKND